LQRNHDSLPILPRVIEYKPTRVGKLEAGGNHWVICGKQQNNAIDNALLQITIALFRSDQFV